MNFKININTDNAAFEDTNELSRILKGVAARLETSIAPGQYNIRDSNGNTVGHYEITE